MKTARMSSLSVAVAILVTGATAAAQTPIAGNGFNSTEDAPYFTAGDLNGQGNITAPGWAGSWVVTVSGTETGNPTPFTIVSGGSPATASSPGDPDQHLQMFGCNSGANKAERAMAPWSGKFTFEFDARYSGSLPTATEQIQFEGTSSTLRPLNIKWEANGNFKVNDQVMLNYNGTAGFANMVGSWVTVRIVCDWDTATFDLYWSNDTDGALAYVGQKVGWKDGGFNATMTVQQMEIGAPKVGGLAGSGLELDRISLVQPATTVCDTAVQHVDGAATGYENPAVIEYRSFEPELTPPPANLVYTIVNRGSVSHSYSVEVMVPTDIEGLFNTGVGNDRVLLADQTQDPHYTLAINPDNAAPPGSGNDPTYTSLDDTFPIPPWLTDNSTSKWITVRPSDGDSFGAVGEYTYQTTFTSPASTTHVYGRVAADDSLIDILVNGASKGVSTQAAQWSAWKQFEFDIEPGDSSVSLQVNNGGTAENPTGLRAEFYGLGAAPSGHWLTAPTGPITVAGGASQDVTVSFDTNTLQAGVYRSFVKFTNLDTCSPAEAPTIREITLTVVNWFVDPPVGVSRDVLVTSVENCPGSQTAEVVLTVGNIDSSQDSSGDVTYSVAEEEECAWLTLDKSGGTVPYNNADYVTGTIDSTGMSPGTYTCSLVFTNLSAPTLPKATRTVTANVLPQGSVWKYEGDVDPTADNSAGPGLNFIVQEGINQGVVETDLGAGDGSVLRLTDTSAAKTKFLSQPPTGISGDLGATVVTRMRVYSASGAEGLAFGIWDDGGNWAEIFYNGPGGTLKELNRGADPRATTTVAGDDQFHIIRLTVKNTSTGRDIYVYFDEDSAPAISLTDAASRSLSTEGFVFGAGSTAGTVDAAFDWITMTNRGAFAPGEEQACLGESLVLSGNCHAPFADADADGDVDQADFAVFQQCVTGANDPGGLFDRNRCGCLDRDKDNDVDELDFDAFEDCATGPGVLWQSSPECP